jgi:rod shape-determining protein MreC
MVDSLAPMQRGIMFLKGKISDIFNHYITNVDASQKNNLLNRKVHELQSEIFKYEEIINENNRLKDLLQFGNELANKKVLAQIVAWDASSDFKAIRINKGAADGVTTQSPVVVSEGLVGYIFRVSKHFSDVLTILDSNNRVDGIVQRTRSHGIIEGFAKGKCLMKYVTRTEPVILNDSVITSGLGNIYPRGLRVGKVTRIERESYGITQYIEISPSVDFGRLEEVIVLIKPIDDNKKKEWEDLDKKGEQMVKPN